MASASRSAPPRGRHATIRRTGNLPGRSYTEERATVFECTKPVTAPSTARSRHLIYRRTSIAPNTRRRAGFVREVCDPKELLPTAYALAYRYTEGRSPVALALMRQMLYRNSVLPILKRTSHRVPRSITLQSRTVRRAWRPSLHATSLGNATRSSADPSTRSLRSPRGGRDHHVGLDVMGFLLGVLPSNRVAAWASGESDIWNDPSRAAAGSWSPTPTPRSSGLSALLGAFKEAVIH